MNRIEIHRGGLIVYVATRPTVAKAIELAAKYNARAEKRWGPNSRAVLSF